MTKFINKRIVLYSLGQAVLIIVGVSVATWFENLNEKRKEREFEKDLLSEMTHNLEADLKWINRELRVLNNGISSSKKIKSILSDKNAIADSLKYYVFDISWYSTASFNTAAYETIKSKGLDLIESNELRQMITQYYEVNQKAMLDQVRIEYNLAWNFYAPEISRKFKTFSRQDGAMPRSLESLRTDEDFKQLINIMSNFKELQYSQFSRLKEKTEKLFDDIKNEVDVVK